MSKNYCSFLHYSFLSFILKFSFSILFFSLFSSALAQSSSVLIPAADAYVRNGAYAAINYGTDTALIIKGSASSGFIRRSYLRFSLSGVNKIVSAKVRIYGRNTDNTAATTIFLFGVANDNWTESGITWNNAPTPLTIPLGSVAVNDQATYYELDVSEYVKSQFAGDKVVSFLIKDTLGQGRNLVFSSKENKTNQPQLMVETSETLTQSNALLFIENADKFPSNDHFVFSRIQTPWTRDSIYAANHDSLPIRIHNKGMGPLVVKNLVLSNSQAWKIAKINGADYVAGSGLPFTINSGAFADVMVKFAAVDQATRVKVLRDTLTILLNDDKFPSKTVFLSGLWQKQGEGNNEPYAQEVINAFGFKTKTGYNLTDANKGDTTLGLKGDEIRPSYFVRADASKPVSIIQIAAYHGCCNTAPEQISWYAKGTNSLKTILTHTLVDGQTLMPRKSLPGTPADTVFSPTTAFGFKIGEKDYTDAAKNPEGKTGIKVWKVFDAKGNIVPDSYIIGNDYLATRYTNYDYQDNMYFLTNLRPEKGTAYFSKLAASPSVLDFGEKLLETNNSLTINPSNTGKSYADGSTDPAITISSVAITGENKSEFYAPMPLKNILNAQEKTTLTVSFKPLPRV